MSTTTTIKKKEKKKVQIRGFRGVCPLGSGGPDRRFLPFFLRSRRKTHLPLLGKRHIGEASDPFFPFRVIGRDEDEAIVPPDKGNGKGEQGFSGGGGGGGRRERGGGGKGAIGRWDGGGGARLRFCCERYHKGK